jgi:hypothetical protein
MTDLKRFLTADEDGPQKALDLAFSYGQIDGSHHKTWTIDQMVRALTGENYEKFINFYRFAPDEGEDGDRVEDSEYAEIEDDSEEREEIYSWDEGGAP